MKRFVFLIPAIFLLAGLSRAESRALHGFVTAVDSPASFEIGEYKIRRDPAQALTVEKPKPFPDAPVTFTAQDIRVGTELEIDGDYNAATHELKAKSVKVFLFDTVVIDRTTQLEKTPELVKSADGSWYGLISIEGQRVVVTESTAITVSPTFDEVPPAQAKTQAEAQVRAQNGKKKTAKTAPPVAFTSLDQLNRDSFVHYEGAVQQDGSVLASKVVFEKAGLEPSEAKLWNKMKPKVKDGNYTLSKPGHLRVFGHGYALFPNEDVQDYVSNLGSRLVPDQQKNLDVGDPLKIDFRFYVVNDVSADCIGYPNGVVVVHSGLLTSVENEAQLAFILSEEIGAATEKAAWRDLEYHARALNNAKGIGTVASFAPFFGGIPVQIAAYEVAKKTLTDDYGRSLSNQADRIGLETMLARGYDIREAPRSWQAISLYFGADQKNFKPSDLDLRRSYLEAEVKSAFVNTDFSGLKLDSPDFRHASQIVGASAKASK